MTKYSNLLTKTKLSTNKSPKLRQPTKNDNLSIEHANKEPIVNFKFAMPSSLAIPVLLVMCSYSTEMASELA